MKIGFVGAGRMGAPMVRRLVEAGHEVLVLGRTDAARQAVTELGATAVADLADAAARADAVIVCVFTDDQVKRVCFDDGLLATMPSGSALVLHTTGSPILRSDPRPRQSSAGSRRNLANWAFCSF